MKRLHRCSAVLLLLCGWAAAAGREAEDPGMAAALRNAAETRGNYRISPDDLLDVTVYQDREMNRKARVDADGGISLPLIGAIKVGGATIGEAQKLIEDKLSHYLVNPQVSLLVDAYGKQLLFVLGEVQKPGPYPISSDARTTLLQAITGAGGFTKLAAPNRAHVLRYAGGKNQDYKVDIKALIRHGDRDKDLVLQPNDVVYVPQSLF